MAALPPRTRQAVALDFNDVPAQEPPPDATIDQAVADMGILPGDPLYGFTTKLQRVADHFDNGAVPKIDEAKLARALGPTIERTLDRRASALSWRTSLMAACVLVTAMVATGAVSYWYGYRSGQTDTINTQNALATSFRNDPKSADIWLNLMKNNDIAKALNACRKRELPDGIACDVPLWLNGTRRLP